MENLYVFKGYGAKKISTEFLNKGWDCRDWGLNKIYTKKATRKWHDGELKEQN